jgi:hypothetical protein
MNGSDTDDNSIIGAVCQQRLRIIITGIDKHV